jgi:hypothetical protein
LIHDAVFEAAEWLAKHLGKLRSALYSEAVIEFLKICTDAVMQQLNAVYAALESMLNEALEGAQLQLLNDGQW